MKGMGETTLTQTDKERVTVEDVEELYEKLGIKYSGDSEFKTFEDFARKLLAEKPEPAVPHLYLRSQTQAH